MNADRAADWSDDKKKNDAVFAVLRYLAEHPDEAQRCVGNDEKAKELFERVGGISVPTDQGARVIFFAAGERTRKVGASVILEIPSQLGGQATDGRLRKFVLGNYDYWAPTS